MGFEFSSTFPVEVDPLFSLLYMILNEYWVAYYKFDYVSFKCNFSVLISNLLYYNKFAHQ